MPNHATSSTGIARLGTIALAGIAAFVAACIASQFLHPDLNWLRAPMSFYLLGDHGGWLRAGYVALALALAALGVGYYRALHPQARSSGSRALFVIGATGLCVTAIADSDRSGLSVEGLIHGIAALTAFLCVSIAMLLQSWCMRGDALWRARFTTAFALALACFVALWVHALWREAPRGLSQKLVMALIVLWLGLAATWLRRAGAVGAGTQPE
ncbi:DUF998 domain-containing protein [Lysobacter sp. D1-1-M9]|uniref:DUF998 domain-containing protein n=1 Tax=Novilysobacter longmucuonensis TaxID=3098603 RepID=UPI002FC914E4